VNSTNIVVVGVDEVGRGCLAGPLVAAAVILNDDIPGLNDSKKLSRKKREELSNIILSSSLDYGIGLTEVDDINKHGLTYAVANAMLVAVQNLKHKYNKIIVDGNYNYLKTLENVSTVVGGDGIIPEISAASIIAKVYRDNLMTELSLKYPKYGFNKHFGYGTKFHLEMIQMYGPTTIHRLFYKPLQKYNQ
jgi:ribonuclease HII